MSAMPTSFVSASFFSSSANAASSFAVFFICPLDAFQTTFETSSANAV